MPVDVQTWRIRVGMFNARRLSTIRACYRRPPRSVETIKGLEVPSGLRVLIACWWMVLSILFGVLRGRIGVSEAFGAVRVCCGCSKGVSSMKVVNVCCGASMMVFCLALALGFLLLRAGDVERNPGPNTGVLTMQDLPVLMVKLKDIARKWNLLGVQLNFTPWHLRGFSPDVRAEPKLALQELLSQWLCRTNPPPTLELLAAIIRGPVIEEESLAAFLLEHREDFPSLQVKETGNSSLTSLASFPSTAEHEGTDSIRDSVKAEVESFEGRFEDLVNETYQTVKETVDVETLLIGIKLLPISLRPDHLEYLMSNERLLEATNHRQIFTSLNFYWSFLNYGLLAHIVRRFGSEATKQKMQVYELDLQQFRKKTPLKVFAEVCPTVHKATPPEFKTVVSKHEWSGCNMEDVEVFRKKFARNYSLPDCAMMLSELVKAGYQEPGVLTMQDLPVLMVKLKEIAGKWNLLGVQLNFTPWHLRGFSPDVRAEPKLALQELLSQWLCRTNPPPTLELLAEIIRGPVIEEESLAAFLLEHREDFPSLQVKETGNSSVTSPAAFPSTAEHEGTDSIRDSVKAEVESFEGRFEDLVSETYQTVKETVDVETLLNGIILLPMSLRSQHLEYLTGDESLLESTKHYQIFTALNVYWSFSNYGLLAHIVWKFGSEATKQKMQVYESDLKQFRKKTPLKVFAEVCPTVHKATPPEFKTVVSKHEWSGCNMEDVEVFRMKFARNYSLPDCAMMLSELVEGGYQEPGSEGKVVKEEDSQQGFRKLENEELVSQQVSPDTGLFALLPSSHVLPGVQFISKTTFRVHGSEDIQTFQWESCGFRMHVPSGALAKSVQCDVTVATSMSGSFEQPQEATPVSAVYYIETSKEFSKPIMLELEHCCRLDKFSEGPLTFAVASTATRRPPYRFQSLQGGDFQPTSSYGCISVSRFSLFEIVRYIRNMLWGGWNTPDMEYYGYFCCKKCSRCKWAVVLVITKKLSAGLQALQSHYHPSNNWHEVTKFNVHFSDGSDSISLDIPSEGVERDNGHWHIQPNFTPKIMKRDIDEFRPEGPASCELTVTCKEDEHPGDLEYCINLSGLQQPDYVLLKIPASETDIPPALSSATTSEIPRPALSSATTSEIPRPALSSATTSEIPRPALSSATTSEIPRPALSSATAPSRLAIPLALTPVAPQSSLASIGLPGPELGLTPPKTQFRESGAHLKTGTGKTMSVESAPFRAITENTERITDTIADCFGPLPFSHKLIEENFIAGKAATDITGLQGVSDREKANKLMQAVATSIRNDTYVEKRFWDFMRILNSEPVLHRVRDVVLESYSKLRV